MGSTLDKYTNDSDFAEAFEPILRPLGSDPNTKILCNRVAGVEFYEFTERPERGASHLRRIVQSHIATARSRVASRHDPAQLLRGI